MAEIPTFTLPVAKAVTPTDALDCTEGRLVRVEMSLPIAPAKGSIVTKTRPYDPVAGQYAPQEFTETATLSDLETMMDVSPVIKGVADQLVEVIGNYRLYIYQQQQIVNATQAHEAALSTQSNLPGDATQEEIDDAQAAVDAAQADLDAANAAIVPTLEALQITP